MHNSTNDKPLIIEEENFQISKLQYALWLKNLSTIISIGVTHHSFILCKYLLNHRVFQTINMDISDKLWSLESAGYTTNAKEDYLFIFGGSIPDPGGIIQKDQQQNAIYVIDLIQMNVLNCKLKCPTGSSGPMRAVCINYKQRDELMVFGFVNEFQNNNNQTNIPVYLINIILCYIFSEYIHIFCDSEHWKLNIDNILCNIY